MMPDLKKPGATLPPLLALLVAMGVAIPRGLPAYMMVFALLALLSYLPLLKNINWRQTFKQLALPWLGFALLIPFTFSSPSDRAFEMLRDTFFIAASASLLFILLPLIDRATTKRLLDYLAATFIVAFVYYTIQFALDFPLDRWLNHKPADFPMMMTNIPKRPVTILALLAWPMAWHLSPRRKLAPLFLLVIGLAILCFTSRASMVGIWAGIALYALANYSPKLADRLGSAALMLAIPATVAFVAFLPPLQQALLPYLAKSGGIRLSIWDAAFAHAAAAWPTGVGLDGSRLFAPTIPTHPHNAFLQIFLELGAAGVAMAAFLMGLLAWHIRQAAPALKPYLWGAAATALGLLSIAYGLWQGWWLAAHAMAAILLALAARQADKSGA